MNIFVAPQRNESGRLRAILSAFPEAWSGRLLDVGCRARALEKELGPAFPAYCGFDLAPPADVVGNLERGLPFGDGSFDTVAALDVAEHTNDIHFTFRELCRVAKRHVVLALPNLYQITTRARFLLGKPISGKYGLPTEPPTDRHRWIFSFDEARRFCMHGAAKQGWRVIREGGLIGPRRFLLGGRLLPSLWPNLFCTAHLALLGRDA